MITKDIQNKINTKKNENEFMNQFETYYNDETENKALSVCSPNSSYNENKNDDDLMANIKYINLQIKKNYSSSYSDINSNNKNDLKYILNPEDIILSKRDSISFENNDKNKKDNFTNHSISHNDDVQIVKDDNQSKIQRSEFFKFLYKIFTYFFEEKEMPNLKTKLKKQSRINMIYTCLSKKLKEKKNKTKSKRNEELLKLVYKIFIKEKTNSQQKSLINKENKHFNKNDKNLNFWISLFYSELIKEKLDFNYFMDLISESIKENQIKNKTKLKSWNLIYKASNSKKKKKFKTLKTISKPLRHLFSVTPDIRKEFTEFVESKNSDFSLFKTFEKLREFKFISLINDFEKIHNETKSDKCFNLKIKKKIQNSKFKFPPLKSEIDKSIETTITDLEDKKGENKKVFNLLKEQFYPILETNKMNRKNIEKIVYL